MRVIVPVTEDSGLDSQPFEHFGSAPFFLIVDTSTMEATAVGNCDESHEHGKCSPVRALEEQRAEAAIVGGIGARALTRLNSMGIRVYQADGITVRECLGLLMKGDVREFTLAEACAHQHNHDT